jgi:hypothetical protein
MMKMAGSGRNVFLTNFSTYDAPFPSKVRLALATPGQSYAPGPAAAATTVSQVVDSWPTDPVRVPTTTDTRTIIRTIMRMTTADTRSSPTLPRSSQVRPRRPCDRVPHQTVKSGTERTTTVTVARR